MHSDADTVGEYIDSFEGETRAVLEGLRRIVHDEMPQFEESMKYRMPTYTSRDETFAFAVQKDYLSVYVNDRELITRHAAAIGKHRRGKNCIRYAKPEHVDMPGLRALLKEVYGA